MNAADMDIDLVYLYVNSNDPEWIAKRNQYAMDQNNGPCRFRDNNELKYSLRSVEKFAPWIRKIFIVSNSSMPDWLNTNHPKVHIIDQQDIMPPNTQPCYNSNAIEAFIHRIPGLSEFFLYACDDMFFGAPVKKDFFVKDGKPIVRMKKAKIKPVTNYDRFILNSQKAVLEHYGKEYDLIPWHNIDVYSKTAMEKCVREFQEEFDGFLHNCFRGENDLQRVIFHYDLLVHDACVLKSYDNRSSLIKQLFDYCRKFFFPSKYLDGLFQKTHKCFQVPWHQWLLYKHPRCACINDSEDTTETDLAKYQALMKKLFPLKSSFEK